jgi:hypothetical protein
MRYTSVSFAVLALAPAALAQYNLVKDYSGKNFFDGFQFFSGTDWNLTNGDVNFLGLSQAQSNKLAYLNDQQRVILKVDNTSNVLYNEKRNSIRVESHDSYPLGSILIFDAYHLPYGCSVWPAFWTAGTEWPANGEIDIIEGVNDQKANQMALHTNVNLTCTKTPGAKQTGKDAAPNCATTTGCTVVETTQNSWGESFAANQGGVWATQFDKSGIFIWFWNRANVPADISSNKTTLDPTSWGTPSAAYPSDNGCDISKQFGPQRMIIDTTLCGDWAGTLGTYNASTCYTTTAPKKGLCYEDNVIGDGSNYATAYFEIASIRAYTVDGATIVHNETSSSSTSASRTVSRTGSSTSPTSGSSDSGNAAAPTFAGASAWLWALGAVVLGAVASL